MKNIFWITGLPCSGKTTIAKELAKKINAEILDGDDIRKFMHNTDFSFSGRKKHMLSVAEIAYRFSKYTDVVVSLVSPIKKVRDEIMDRYPNVKMIWAYAPLELCKKRDVKGMYAKALSGEIKNFTGISAPYEEPNYERHQNHRAYRLDTELGTAEECVDFIYERWCVKEKHSLFIGRWQIPTGLHQGHIKLIEQAKYKPLIGIRDTEIDEKNPYSAQERKKKIEALGYETIILPDIAEVLYGRGVGYEVKELKLEKEIEAISGTKIRNENKN